MFLRGGNHVSLLTWTWDGRTTNAPFGRSVDQFPQIYAADIYVCLYSCICLPLKARKLCGVLITVILNSVVDYSFQYSWGKGYWRISVQHTPLVWHTVFLAICPNVVCTYPYTNANSLWYLQVATSKDNNIKS